jgi:hypothetical protein
MSKVIFFAQQPTFQNNGRPQSEFRTKEHWVQIDKFGDKYSLTFGDERGQIQEKKSQDLEGLLENALNQINGYDMDIITDFTNQESRPYHENPCHKCHSTIRVYEIDDAIYCEMCGEYLCERPKRRVAFVFR